MYNLCTVYLINLINLINCMCGCKCEWVLACVGVRVKRKSEYL